MKDPLNNMGFAMKKAIERMRTNKDNPKLTLNLSKEVHPRLAVSSIPTLHFHFSFCIMLFTNDLTYMLCTYFSLVQMK